MPRRRFPPPEAVLARWYREAHRKWDEEPVGRYGPAGFAFGRKYRGEYARRPEYTMSRADLKPPRPLGSGWPAPVREVPPDAEERHLAALADRDLACAVAVALDQVLGLATARRLVVYARDGRIALAGRLDSRRRAREALETALAVPGVQRVRNHIRVPISRRS